ncbi:hypothetical protein CNMCM5793_006976 [Aspergillus hiratsukae]|uniref:Apple domain-containing protein n=1 Tax=Aspergillus hiratsukae TaxID=1194566 RepID=A0A8H6PI52_9EURO|nr:hypothetical protein CNMCM5793_006976 [Aspergillus hiratsukae]
MKFSALALAVLLGAAHAGAQCVPGKREEVISGYEVEYQCDTYRTGKLHTNVATIEECAQLCKDAGSSYCAHRGVYFMTKVDDEPFPDDPEEPFPGGDCDTELEDCEEDLKQCRAALKAKGFRFTSAQCTRDNKEEVDVAGQEYKIYCDRHHDPKNPLLKVTGVPFSECMTLCNHRKTCTYTLWKQAGGHTCHLFSRQVAYTTVPGIPSSGDNDWKTAVKKV